MPTPKPTELLSARQLAAELHMSEATLSQWRYLKQGPTYVKLGNSVRYRRSDVDQWIAENTFELSAVAK